MDLQADRNRPRIIRFGIQFGDSFVPPLDKRSTAGFIPVFTNAIVCVVINVDASIVTTGPCTGFKPPKMFAACLEGRLTLVKQQVYIAVMENWSLAMRLFFGLPVALLALLTIFEPQPRFRSLSSTGRTDQDSASTAHLQSHAGYPGFFSSSSG